jgi:UPF0755 protein
MTRPLDSSAPKVARRRRPSRPPASKVRATGSKKPPPKASQRFWYPWIGLTLLVLAPVAALLFWATRPGPGTPGPVATRFAGGESAAEVAERLAELGLVESPLLFELYFGWFSPSVSVARGPHLLRFGLTPRELVQRLGRLASRQTARVTFPEGYNHLQIAERLEQKEICARDELVRAARDPALLAELGVGGSSAEGYLFPATYDLFRDSDPAEVVRQLVRETRKRLGRLDERLGGPLARVRAERGFTEREILTLASVIEKEARARDEQPLIASVFYNRLDDPAFRPARMLQSDATAIYGCLVAAEHAPSCAGFRGRVTPDMLRDAANPYNTYRRPGLPAGPIANPGEGAIAAALAPAKTDYLFFVSNGLGGHRFSRTFEEHRRAITGE